MNPNNNGQAERLPPASLEAERSVIGSILRDNRAIDEVIAMLAPESFYQDAHQKMFRCIVHLCTIRQPVDLVTLAEALKKHDWLTDAGGYAYLAELWDASPTSANVAHYAKIVREMALCRSLIHVSNDFIQEAYAPYRPADEMLAEAERRILQVASKQMLGETVRLKGALSQTIKVLEQRAPNRNGSSQMMLTGYFDLDERTAGLHPGELTIIAARPSVGKTALAINILSHFTVDRKCPAFFASLEQSRTEIGERLLAMHSNVSCHDIRKGDLGRHAIDSIVEATERLSDAPLTIDDSPNQNMLKIGANARRLRQSEGIKLAVVDYLQLIEPDNKRENRNEQIGGISRKLKFLARELEIPVVVLCQLSREAARDEKPKLHHLRDSGNIEQDADTVLLLYRPEESHRLVEIDVAKQRNGPTGSLTLGFNRQLMRFENYAPELMA